MHIFKPFWVLEMRRGQPLPHSSGVSVSCGHSGAHGCRKGAPSCSLPRSVFPGSGFQGFCRAHLWAAAIPCSFLWVATAERSGTSGPPFQLCAHLPSGARPRDPRVHQEACPKVDQDRVLRGNASGARPRPSHALPTAPPWHPVAGAPTPPPPRRKSPAITKDR